MSIRTDRIHSRLTPVEPAAERLPFWSRSTNPIVRRHLGLYWRTLPPELMPVLRIVLGWAVVLIGGVLFINLLHFALVFLIVSFVVLPVMTLWYAHVLIEVAVRSAAMMQEERRDNTLTLLMATPMSLEQILLGKVAAAFWRRMDDWVLIVYGVALAAPPALYSVMSPVWQETGSPLLTSVAVVGGLAVALLRIMLEPIMIGMIGVFVGAVVPYRNTAISLSVALGAAYVVLINLLARLPSLRPQQVGRTTIAPDYGLVLLIEFVLPILLPALITWGLLRVTARLLRRD
jgi:hypothetical protein